MNALKTWGAAALLALASGGSAVALPPAPPFPRSERPPPSPVDGVWYFRGDPRKPCYVETVPGPQGPMLVFTNENGTQALGQLSRDGRRVTIPDWNLTGRFRGNALVWPNGDFWGR